MELTYEETEQYLTKIFTGNEYVYIGDMLVVFSFPTNTIRQKATLVYQRSFEDAVSKNILPLKELKDLVEKRNIITVTDKLKVKKLESQLEAQEVLLSKTTRVKANQDRIKGVIRRLKHELFEINVKITSKLSMSAENKAEEDRAFYICSQCAYQEDGKTLFWSSYEEALKTVDIDQKDGVLLAFLRFYSGFSTQIIRSLARSNLWRIRYVNSIKTSDPLFGVPASDYTTDQLNIVYWSNYYQNIYEMMPEDRPSDMIIEDDDTLDAYMRTLYEDRNKEEAGRRHKSKRSGKLSAFDSEEVIVTRSHELYNDIEYDKPREAMKLKERTDVRKRTKRG